MALRNEPLSNPKPAAAGLDEPSAGSALVPVWMVLLMGALFYWGQLYLDGHAGGFSKDVYAPFNSFAQVAAAQPKDESAKFLAQGEDVFNKTCVLCHQPNGLGKEGQFPPLAGSDWVLAAGPNRIGRIVLDGGRAPSLSAANSSTWAGLCRRGARSTPTTRSSRPF